MKSPKICIWLPVSAIDRLKSTGIISHELSRLGSDFYWDGLPFHPDDRIYVATEKKQVTFYPDDEAMRQLRRYCDHNGKSITSTIMQALLVLNLYQLPE